MNVNQEATIMKLPVEVLQLILEFVPALDHVRFQIEGGRSYDHAQLLVIRQVCRLFRIISHDLPVWRDENFDFSSLLPYEADEQLGAFREGKFLRALFDDDNFVARLRRKKSWRFSTLESVFAVLYGVPSFRHNAIQLDLGLMEGIDIALRRLSVCQRIVDITLDLISPEIDLGVFANSFPFLQSLSVHGLSDYVGSLSFLSVLQSLDMSFDFFTNEFDMSLVPIKSGATLTKLSITSRYSFELAEVDSNPLDIFYNLSDLSLRPLDTTFGTFIVNTKTQLTSLNIFFLDHVPLDLVLDVLSSRCLSRLESFTFTVPVYLLSVDFEHEVLELGVPIIDSLTSNLSSLKTLKVNMGLYLGWSRYFSRLKNLKSLTWTVPEGDYKVFMEADDEDLFIENEGPKITAERAFERAFAGHREKPIILIEFT